jgi:hypothetical protein
MEAVIRDSHDLINLTKLLDQEANVRAGMGKHE